jgi:hypothetical protein
MRFLTEHMTECDTCSREYSLMRYTQMAVGGLKRKQPPPELTLRLRVLVSREAARRRRPLLAKVQMRFAQVTSWSMAPATAGALSAMVVLGLLIGFFAAPAPLQASSDDVPTRLYTPPQLVTSPFSCSCSPGGNSVVVEALVDESGRVQDYRILSAPENYDRRKLESRLENMLIFAVFQPARAFGRPTTGRAILSFSKVVVKG